MKQEWEKEGQVLNVVFVEGMAQDGKRWLSYYGGADKYVGVAVARTLPHIRPTYKGMRRSIGPVMPGVRLPGGCLMVLVI